MQKLNSRKQDLADAQHGAARLEDLRMVGRVAVLLLLLLLLLHVRLQMRVGEREREWLVSSEIRTGTRSGRSVVVAVRWRWSRRRRRRRVEWRQGGRGRQRCCSIRHVLRRAGIEGGLLHAHPCVQLVQMGKLQSGRTKQNRHTNIAGRTNERRGVSDCSRCEAFQSCHSSSACSARRALLF